MTLSEPVELGSYFLGPMWLYRVSYLPAAQREANAAP
jgi:hypothetical protein